MAQDGSVESRAHAGARAGTWSGRIGLGRSAVFARHGMSFGRVPTSPHDAVAAMGRPRNCRRSPAALARGRLRSRHRHLLHRGTGAGVVGGDGTGRGLRRRRRIAAPASGRLHRRSFCFRHRRGLCRRHGENRHDRTSGAALSGLGRAADGRTFAIRGADGLLAFHHSGGDTFAIKEWLAADADARDYHDRKLGQGIACDRPRAASASSADGSDRRLRSRARRVRGRLPPRRSHHDDPRPAARLSGSGDRPDAMARTRRVSATPHRFGFCDRFRTTAEFRSAMGAAARAGH